MSGKPSGTRVVAVAGAKGGVGKTTTAINLAAALSEYGLDVVAVELDLAMANMRDFLAFEEEPSPTLHDVLAGTADAADATYEREEGFDVVPSGIDLEGFAETDLDGLPALLSGLRKEYDVILLDTGAGATRETLEPLKYADEAALVTTPRAASIRDATKTRELVESVDSAVTGIVITKAGTSVSPDAEQISEYLTVDLLGRVPHDVAIPESQDMGRPVVIDRPETAAAEAYRAVAGRLVDRIADDLAADVEAPDLSDPDETGPETVASAAAVSDGGTTAQIPDAESSASPETAETSAGQEADESSADAAPTDAGAAIANAASAADESDDDGGSLFARLAALLGR